MDISFTYPIQQHQIPIAEHWGSTTHDNRTTTSPSATHSTHDLPLRYTLQNTDPTLEPAQKRPCWNYWVGETEGRLGMSR